MSACRECGRPVPKLMKGSIRDNRGLDMSVMDRERLFCTMRCAARFGVKAASPTPSNDTLQGRGEVEADLRHAVRRILARCEAVEDENSDQLAKEQTEASSGFLRGERHLAKSIRRELHDLTRAALQKETRHDG